VIYLHNLQFKQSVPPSVVGDWRDESVARPISAFLQLITDLEIWLEDSDDPLGLLKDTMQIRRPLDQNRPSKDYSDTTDTEISVEVVQKVNCKKYLLFQSIVIVRTKISHKYISSDVLLLVVCSIIQAQQSS